MTSSLDAYWLVSLANDSNAAEATAQCVVRVSTSDILRDLARGPGSLIRRHFHRTGDLPGYIADHLETVRRVVACEIVAPLYFSSFVAGIGAWKWRDAQQAPGFQESESPSGNIGDFPVWQSLPARTQPGSPRLASDVAGRWMAVGERRQIRARAVDRP